MSGANQSSTTHLIRDNLGRETGPNKTIQKLKLAGTQEVQVS
jgi:hypothetical protein